MEDELIDMMVEFIKENGIKELMKIVLKSIDKSNGRV